MMADMRAAVSADNWAEHLVEQMVELMADHWAVQRVVPSVGWKVE